jgi:aryl-alcohol dehydrogenase-like predicted oxidoreductase
MIDKGIDMHLRALGRTGLDIAPLVFGGNVFGWTADEKTSFSLLDAFVDAGLNAVDTADVYSAWAEGNHGGESETIIGNWLRRNPGKRSGIVLITKVGSKLGPDKKGLSARRITEAVEDSLRRLATDHIDLYLSHWPDPDVPIEETLAPTRSCSTQARSVPSGRPTWMPASSPARSMPPAKTACPATTSCNRSTTCTSAPSSTARCAP